MAMAIPMSKADIKDIADRINLAVDSLKDIDKILADTEDAREIANKLKQQAEDASWVLEFFGNIYSLIFVK